MKKIITTALAIAFMGGSSLAISAEVDQRLENQKDRIEKGEASGELTKGEAKGLERKDKAIGKEIAADRAANGGTLTAKEKKKINRQENRNSRKIRRRKHNEVETKDAK